MPKAPITIGMIVTFMFHRFFQFSSKVEVLISLFTFFQFYSVVCWDSKVDNLTDFIIIIIIIIIIIPCKFPALSEGLSLGSEWLEISSNIQDSSQYSGQS